MNFAIFGGTNKPLLMTIRKGNTERQKSEEWKISLADAVLEEARFNGCPIKEGTDIEHQLGTVWLGKVAISAQLTEQDALTKATEKWDVPKE